MKQELINFALSILQTKRRNAVSQYEEKMQSLYNDPDYQKLNSAYNKIMIENARKQAYGHKQFSETEEKLKKELDLLKTKYNVQNLSPNFACKKCEDKGYVDGQMCSCLKTEISKLLLAGSGFEKLEDFSDSKKTSDQLAPVYDLMEKWCASDFKKNLVLLSGQTGIGKTHLMRCMANDLIKRGKVVKIVTSFHLNNDFREFSKTQNEQIIQNYIDCEILFVDDLGSEPLYKNVTVEYFYLVINERKMRGLATVITTNLDMADIREHYDERIWSRIADRETSITIQMLGTDRRLKSDKK